MMSALKREGGVLAKNVMTVLIGIVNRRVARGRGSKNPKILRTSYVNGPSGREKTDDARHNTHSLSPQSYDEWMEYRWIDGCSIEWRREGGREDR